MSGWIKWEKDLETDPRFTRVVRQLTKRSSNAGALQGVEVCNAGAYAITSVVGALLRLWSYADTHIREDDTLDMGPDEIDDLVGIKGFAAALPAEWLRTTDDGHVELPDYQLHNSVEAKKKAQTAKRVAKHRASHRNADVTQAVRPSVTGALPDQTRPDQTKTTPIHTQSAGETEAEKGAGAGNAGEGERGADLDTHRTHAHDWESNRQWVLDELQPVYPSNVYPGGDWETTARVLAGRLTGGETTREQLLQLTTDFAAQMTAMRRRNTEFVENPVRHFDGRGRWRGPFVLPAVVTKPRDETAMERIQRKNSTTGPRIIDGEVANG